MRYLICFLLFNLAFNQHLVFTFRAIAEPPAGLINSLNQEGLIERSESKYTYWGFEVYKAKLFTPALEVDIQKNLGSFPLALSLTYSRDLTSKDFVESGEIFIKENPEVDFTKVKPFLEQMNNLYEDVCKGDTYTLKFSPGSGIKLFLNEQFKGQINDDYFAKSYLGIWLSRNSISSSFTKRLVDIKK